MTIGLTTGLVSWTPSAAGSFNVGISATNAVGSDVKSLSITVTQPADTGLKKPTANAADTLSSGDNNGFETTPTNAYDASTTTYAVDASSGSTTATTCTDAGKDKHRFFNYGFSIPFLSTISGIEVQLNALASSTKGAPKICVQLSWDGGNTWTTGTGILSTTTLTTGNVLYTLGSATNTWGRTWANTDFNDGNFRVRVIDVASNTSTSFSLGNVAVRVHY